MLELGLKGGVVESAASGVLIALTLQGHWTAIGAEGRVVICTVRKGT